MMSMGAETLVLLYTASDTNLNLAVPSAQGVDPTARMHTCVPR